MAPDVVVVGLGRVGLPTAAWLSASGLRVLGVDTDVEVRRAIALGTAGSAEPGLAQATAGLRVSETPVPAAIYVVCVPTPAERGRADLSLLFRAIEEVALVAPDGALVVVESTVPVGTTDTLAAAHPRLDVAVAPERVLPGRAMVEIVDNDRIVGGAPRAAERAAGLFRRFVRGRVDVVDARTAELAKLVENASRDVELALANQVAGLCDGFGVDRARLFELVRRHPRVRLLEPGIGVGGHCLPVDPWFLIEASPAGTSLLRAAREVNDAVPEAWIERLAAIPGRFGLLGLSYKPDTDDRRESPAVRIARALAGSRDVRVHDPFGGEPDLPMSPLDEVLDRDVVVHLVAHRAYRGLRGRVRAGAVVVDAAGGFT